MFSAASAEFSEETFFFGTKPHWGQKSASPGRGKLHFGQFKSQPPFLKK
jgi:hypothetical protein